MLIIAARTTLIGGLLATLLAANGQSSAAAFEAKSEMTDAELTQLVAPMRAGRKLTPKSWPTGARVAVCLTWDVEHEIPMLNSGITEPSALSQGEYGAKEGLPRILALLDKYSIPASFYIPGATVVLYPDLVSEFRRRPQHEVGIHGWMHESPATLKNRQEEERLLRKSVALWTKALGRRPVGYRAPGWAFSNYTLDLIRNNGFEYDSSAMSMNQPYELLSHGQPTGLVELPVNWALDDGPYLAIPGGALPSPELTFQVYRDEFDLAYEEGTMFLLTMHPTVVGRRSSIVHLEKLIVHIKSKPGVWFATAREISDYVRKEGSL